MAPPWRSVTCFWAICNKWNYRDSLQTAVKWNWMWQHIFFSCFSFIRVFTVPGPSWSVLSSLLKMAFCITETLSAPLSCDYSLTRHDSIPGSYFFCNIFMVIMNRICSLPELEGHFFMDIHVLFSVLAAMLMVNQKISNSLCIDEEESISQIDVLRVWHESYWFPPWLSSVSSQVNHFTSLGLSSEGSWALSQLYLLV